MPSALTVPVAIAGGVSGSGSAIPITTQLEPVIVGQSILIVVAFADITRTIGTITDDVGNTYTTLGPYDGTTQRFYVCHTTILYPTQQLPVGSTITVGKINGTYATAAKVFKIATGLKKTSTFDKAGTVGSGTSTAPLSGSSGTLAQADELLIGIVASNSTSSLHTVTIAAPFTALGTKQFQSGIDLHAGYQIVTADTAQTVSGTLSTSRAWGALVVAFRAAAIPDTLQISSVAIESDFQRRSVRNSQAMMEIDQLQTSVLASAVHLEVDAVGDNRSVSGVLLELDWTPPRTNKPSPQIIS